MAKQNPLQSCCRLLRQLLIQADFTQADHVILKLTLLALRGETDAAKMMSLAAGGGSMTEAVQAHLPETGFPAAVSTGLIDAVGQLLFALKRQPVVLGDIYEQLAFGRKAQGVYYTPLEVIDFILANTLEQTDILADPYVKVLDPACGCGNFLLRAYDMLLVKLRECREQLIERYPQQDWSDDGMHRHILQHNLWGADLDSLAVDITSAGLLLKRPACPVIHGPNIIVCDSLQYHGENEAGKHRDFWRQRYQFVLGNPPYLSFGLRGNGNLAKEYRSYLKQAFPGSAEYKLSYYVLFMEQGITRLSDGGCLGFIVPDSFLLGRFYSKIRSTIMQHTAIEALVHIDGPVFKKVSTGFTAICIFRKREQSLDEEQPIQVYRVKDKAELADAAPVNQMKQAYYATLPYQRFRLFFDATAEKLIDKIEQAGSPLKKYATGHTGIRALAKQGEIIQTVSLGESWHRGLISGSQINRYELNYGGHWLNIDPTLLYKGGWRPEIVASRKMLVRQTGYNLLACIDAGGLYHLNNIHSFLTRQSDVSVDYLALLFNSELLSFYYHVVSMEYGRPMAQTDIESLEQLPICCQPEINRQAGQLYTAMQSCLEAGRKGNHQALNRFYALDDYVNQLVFRIYQLSDEEVAYVKRYEKALKARYRTRKIQSN